MRRRFRAVYDAENIFLEMITSRESALVEVHIHPSLHRIRTFYLKGFFEDGSSHPDVQEVTRVDHSDLDSLRAGLIKALTRTLQGDAAELVRQATSRVRIVVVQNTDAPPAESSRPSSTAMSPKQFSQYVEALPTLELSEAGAVALSSEACTVCLDGYECGSSIVCLPCPGRHISHHACCSKWIAASQPPTCPVCRFALPAVLVTSESVTLAEEDDGPWGALLKCLHSATSSQDAEHEATMTRELMAGAHDELLRIQLVAASSLYEDEHKAHEQVDVVDGSASQSVSRRGGGGGLIV